MPNMNYYLPTVPFDIYQLHLFHLVTKSASFTKAGEQAGLTQSAITRQIKGMEDRLGIPLLERTTRYVSPTPAGKFLLEQSEGVLRDINTTLQRLREDFALAPKTIRVGVSRSIGLAYLPGFFFAFQKKFPAVQTQVLHESSQFILGAIEEKELDVGLLCASSRLPRGLQITHRFDDDFTVIAPPQFALPAGFEGTNPTGLLRLFTGQRWLLIHKECHTGQLLHQWMTKAGLRVQPTMQMDNFDLIVNLVAMGMGVSLVPNRTLALYQKLRPVQRIRMTPQFSRQLVVLVRKDRKPPERIRQFVENVLF